MKQPQNPKATTMTLRDAFALALLHAWHTSERHEIDFDRAPDLAYEWADAMLKARAK